MSAHLGQLVAHYGYAIVALFLFAEGLLIPVPTDSTLVTAAAFAANGRLSLVAVFLVATVATSVGTTVAFFVGRGGMTLFERYGPRFHLSMHTLERTRAFFERHGESTILVGRFLPVVRMLVSPVAGLSGMSARRFTAYNVVGAAVWSATFCALGYFFGHHLSGLYRHLGRATLVVGVSLGAIVTIVMAGGWLIEDSEAAWRAEGTVWHHVLMSPPVRWISARSPAARAFLFRRFTPGHYLGLNLTLGLGLSFIALVMFSAMENAIATREAVLQFDLNLAQALQAGATPSGITFWGAVGQLGTIPVMTGLGIAVALLLAVRREWLAFAGWVSGLVGGTLLDTALKLAMQRARPVLPAVYDVEPTFSFPSGHALGAIITYGLIAYFLVLLVSSHRIQSTVVLVTLLLVLALSFSRLYLGQHFFSDVVGGLAAGGVWLSACVTGLEVARRKREHPRTTTA